MHDRPKLWNQVQRVFLNEKVRLRKRMRNSLVLVSGGVMQVPVLLAEKSLMLICLNTQTDNNSTPYVFLQYMACTPTLDRMDKELVCKCLRQSATDEEDHSPVAGEEQNNRTELNVGYSLEVEPFSAVRSLLRIVRGNYNICLLIRAVRWPYHCFYKNRFYRDDILKPGIIQREGQKDAVNMLNKALCS